MLRSPWFPLVVFASALGLSACGESGDDDDSAGPSDLCNQYCDLVMANCQDANKLYESADECLSACETIPDTGEDGATSGNSIQCRIYHAGDSAAGAEPATHCPHAGENPTDQCVD